MEYFTEEFVLNFGKVVVGKVYKKTFEPPKVLEIISITRSTYDNTLDTQFTVSVCPNKRSFYVTFTPERPGQACCNYFFVVYDNYQKFTFIAKGESEELALSFGCNSLTMMTRPGGRCRQILKLSNTSKTPGRFEFFFDESLLEVEPAHGRVKPMNYKWISITYKPKKAAIFYTEIFGIIHYHDPLILSIKGACYTESSIELPQHIHFSDTIWRGKSGYEEVFGSDLNECVPQRNVLPIQIVPKSLDVGSVCFRENGDNRKCATFIVNCNTDVSMLVKWRKDPSNIFSITPRSLVMSPKSSSEFTVTFCPEVPDKFYKGFMRATLKWADNFVITLPYFTGLFILGNSFDENNCGWSTEFSMTPKSIIMPPTIPNFSVFTTMIIEKHSPIPLMFRFIPPKQTYFEIWPMQGIIESSYKIFIIKMRAGPQAHISRKEVWKVKINTSIIKNFTMIGTIEVPIINFFSSLDVSFPPTYLNCYNDSLLWMNNPTRLTLWFEVELKTFEKCLSQIGGRGPFVIRSNELVTLSMRFCPKTVGDYKTSMFVNPFVIDPSGEKVIFKYLVVVKGCGVEPSFTVIPEKLWCSDTTFKKPSCEAFTLKNTGDAIAHVSLSYASFNPLLKTGNIVIRPLSFSMVPKEEVNIKLEFLADEAGYQEIEFFAIIHKSDDMKEIIKKIKIIDVVITVVFPLLKIADMKMIQVPQLISKYAMWFSLNVPKINDALEELVYNDNIIVNCKAPEGEQHVRPIVFKMLLKNYRNIPCCFSFDTSCTCIDRQKADDDEHKCSDELVFSPSSGTIEVNGTVVVQLSINYNLEDLEKLPVKFSIGSVDNRTLGTVTLLIERFVITESMMSGDLPFPSENGIITYNLRPVFIGTPHPPFQAIWTYNNTRAETFYDVKMSGKDSKYLKLFSQHGPIKGRTFTPIVIRFIPNQLREYLIKMKLSIGSKVFKLHVIGSGIAQIPNVIIPKMPFHSQFKTHYPGTISIDYVTVDKLWTHSFKKVAVSIKNMSDKTITFEWTRFVIGGLLHTSVQPQRGDLYPGEIMPCLVNVRSYSFPMKITVSLFCKLTVPEITEEWMNHRKKFSRMVKEVENAFIISDGNISHLDIATLRLKSEPEPFYVTLTIHVDCAAMHDNKAGLPSLSVSDRYKLTLNAPIPPALSPVAFNTLNRVFWDFLESEEFIDLISVQRESPYYQDLKMKILTQEPCKNHPKRCMASILDDTIYTLVNEMLNINSNWDFNYNILYPLDRVANEHKCPIFSMVNSLYFREVLMEANSRFTLYRQKRSLFMKSKLKRSK